MDIIKKKAEMLKELADFINENKKLPSAADLENKKFFANKYHTYVDYFGSLGNAIGQCQIVSPSEADLKKEAGKNKELKRLTGYKKNLMTGKIHNLLLKNKNAGAKELKEIFGSLSRSVIVTYYAVHKKMFGTSGSLSLGTIKRGPNTRKARVISYFSEHPDHTIAQAEEELNIPRKRIIATISSARQKGASITFRKMQGNRGAEYGKALQIRNFFRENPDTTTRECAKSLNYSLNYVRSIVSKSKINGKLPNKKCKIPLLNIMQA